MTVAASFQPSHHPRGRWWFALAIGLSLALHLGLLKLKLQAPESSETRPSRPLVVALEAVETPKESVPEPVQARPEIKPAEMPPAIEGTTEQSLADPVIAPEAPGALASDANSEQNESEPADSPTTLPTSTRVLATVRANLGSPQPPPAADAITPASAPRLPDAPGWINEYVGRLETQVEQWKNADGTREARIVTASGQVYCGRARAPTNAEIFNPQFAMNIMLFRDCGRVRPQAADRSDPWIRAPDR